MKQIAFGLGLALVMAVSAPGWQPSGWMYADYPYVYDSASGDWYWFSPNNAQWAYGFSPADGWKRINNSALAHGWTWYAWPYAYHHGAQAWYFFSADGRQWCVNMRTGAWSVFGIASANTGDYLVIDLSGGPSAASYPVSYLSSVPSGGWTDEYKTTKLVLRRIPAGIFTMGTPAGELGRYDYDDEAVHDVTLTKNFFIGVFEVTQRQWERVMGTWPSFFDNTMCRNSRPVQSVSYYDIRENPADSAISPNWPQSSQVHPDSFIGILRAKTGLTTLDLPTESQWEYACRAGTTTALNSGKNLTNIDSCPNVSEVGRYWHNGGSGYTQGGDTSVGTAVVGSYLPNAWGLYDMHGNVGEWCLDWHATYPGTVTDPGGAAAGSYRVVRGGSWFNTARPCRSGHRIYESPLYGNSSQGFRLARPLP